MNAWAESAQAGGRAGVEAEPFRAPVCGAEAAPIVRSRACRPVPADQLMRDIAEIERVRDVLAASRSRCLLASSARRR